MIAITDTEKARWTAAVDTLKIASHRFRSTSVIAPAQGRKLEEALNTVRAIIALARDEAKQ